MIFKPMTIDLASQLEACRFLTVCRKPVKYENKYWKLYKVEIYELWKADIMLGEDYCV